MKNRWIALFVSVTVGWFAAAACTGGGGGAPAAPLPDVNFAIEQYSAASDAMKNGDLDAAKAVYEKTLAGSGSSGAKSVSGKKSLKDLPNGNLDEALSEYEKTVAGTPNDVKANFGIGLIKLAQLGQGAVGAAILDKFGQPPLKTTLVLGPNGYLAQLDKYHQSCQNKPNLKAFPFGNLPKIFKNPNTHHIAKEWGRLISQAKPDLSTAAIQKALADIAPTIKDVVGHWEISEKDPNFSFTLPKELFYANENVVITHADLTLGISSLYGVLSGINFANSWTADIDLGKLIDPSGNLLVPKKDLVNTLNKFFTLKADNQLADAKTNLLKSIQKGQDSLKQYQSKPKAALIVNDSVLGGIAELLQVSSDVLSSFDKAIAVSTTQPVLTLNLGSLFSSPPDANKIDIDAFVLEGDHIKPVESFFQKMVDGIADAKLSQKTFKIFTSAVKSKNFRKTVFATFINLFKDPQYPSCKPAVVTCTPACGNKKCGDDGCGGSCGTCAAGNVCDAAGLCVAQAPPACAPKCDGKKCGDDGCGGSCGTCAAGSACDAATSQCVATVNKKAPIVTLFNFDSANANSLIIREWIAGSVFINTTVVKDGKTSYVLPQIKAESQSGKDLKKPTVTCTSNGGEYKWTNSEYIPYAESYGLTIRYYVPGTFPEEKIETCTITVSDTDNNETKIDVKATWKAAQ